jgi:ABC-2 type transport system permease protein
VVHVTRAVRLRGAACVLGKTLRDSRIAMLAVLALLGLMIVAGGQVMSSTYGSPEARAGLARMTASIPASLRGFYGDPIRVDTTGGFINWHYGSYFVLVGALWSILALSATVAAEARRGSLDLALTSGLSRRRVAWAKVAGHAIALALVASALGVIAWATGTLFALDARDAIPPDAAAGFAVGMFVRVLVAGSLAFALAPVLGRAAAAGTAGAVLVAGYVLYGYRTVVPAFDSLAGLTPWAWSAGHAPLAGAVDWPGIGATAAVAVLLLVVGAEAFARRDVGVTLAIPLPPLPDGLAGIGGPVRRCFGDLLGGAVWWGIGLGVYGATMAVASQSLLDLLHDAPAVAAIFRSVVPGLDITTAGGFLQLAFVDLGLVLVGFAAATVVAGSWSDEPSGRLEVLLATPMSRARWSLAAAVAGWLAIWLLTAMLAIATALGVAFVAQDAAAPALGMVVLALYGCALVGVGVAVGGLGRSDFAVPVVTTVVIGTFLLDTLAPILRLPDWVAQLALTTHLGEPMVGRWDATGVLACLVIAVGGLALGAWGMRRRDVAG